MDGKKRRLREMRPVARNNEDGTVSTHKLSWVGDETKKRGEFGVFPTITPNKGKETSSDPKDWSEQTAKEAAQKGELIKVKRRIVAERLAAGSWKKGADRREAMKEYRNNK